MRLEHHLVGGYVRYISPHIIIIIIMVDVQCILKILQLIELKVKEFGFYPTDLKATVV